MEIYIEEFSNCLLFQEKRAMFRLSLREGLYELTHNDNLVTSVMPIGDGITVSTKIS